MVMEFSKVLMLGIRGIKCISDPVPSVALTYSRKYPSLSDQDPYALKLVSAALMKVHRGNDWAAFESSQIKPNVTYVLPIEIFRKPYK